ncbi:MAG: glycosyltransferase family 39 protein [Aquificaceae bacterium]|uniref:ArnT family glycosyltransferase n=1 Tax=Hydrogenobacter sp. Uz 6-8 TaxID=3384828 RepID=UPI0030A97663
MFLVFILLALLSLLPNLHRYTFKNEESLRTQIAFEMWHSGHYLQPTLFGEPYFNKPPLFNWLIVLYSHIIPWSELTARAVSLTSLTLLTLLVGVFSYYLFKNIRLSLLSSLILLTSGNILFFYGYLAEIDITFSLFVFLGMFFLYLWWERASFMFALSAGLVFGISFMLKGLPAYAFMGISMISFALYRRDIRYLMGKGAIAIYLFSLIVPALWLVQLAEPVEYIKSLWRESFSRVGGEFSRLSHMLFYPLINFKDLLPWSLLFLLSLWYGRKELTFPSQIQLLTLLFLLNYLPYWISDSSGRYIMPLYPLLAIIFSYYTYRALSSELFKRLLLFTLVSVILLRLLYGIFFFPYAENRESSRKRIAESMAGYVSMRSSIACQCQEEKSVCLYLGIWKGEPLRLLTKTRDPEYSVTCGEHMGILIAEYRLRGRTIRLEKLKHSLSAALNY